MAVGRGRAAQQAGERAAGFDPHLAALEEPGAGIGAAGSRQVRQMLHQVATEDDVQQLHAAADGQQRHVPLDRGVQERQLRGVRPGRTTVVCAPAGCP